MVSFNTRAAAKKVVVEIWGKAYTFEVSPTNYSYIKQVQGFGEDIQSIVDKISTLASAGTSAEALLKAYDEVYQRERGIIEFLFPGKFDELFAEAGSDLLVTAQMIAFVIRQISEAFSSAAIETDVVKPADGPPV